MDRNDLLTRKFKEFEGLFRDAAKRYRIPAKVDEEDVLQECLILINELLNDYPNVDPDSHDFTKILKTAVYRRVISLVRKHLTESRNYHLESHSDGSEIAARWSSDSCMPSTRIEFTELKDQIRAGLTNSDTIALWELLAGDSGIMDTLDRYNDHEWTRRDGTKWKLTRKCRDPYKLEVLRFHLGWDTKTIQYHMRIIRRRAKSVLIAD